MVSEEAYKNGGRCRGLCEYANNGKLEHQCTYANECYQYKVENKKTEKETIHNEVLKEDNPRFLKLKDSEILWLSNLMCSEIDGTEASHSLYEKIDRLYQEVFNNKVGD